MSNRDLKRRAREQLGSSLFSNAWMTALLVCVLVTVITGAAAGVAAGIGGLLVLGALSYGCDLLFLKQARDDEPMEIAMLFDGFRSRFGELFALGFLSSLFIALWSMLFVIPGIVKAYSWALIYYIKADHPENNWRQCMDESAAMMKGHKAELFLLDLSFFGWYLLGGLCFGIGTLWVVPYHSAARAQYYEALYNDPYIY